MINTIEHMVERLIRFRGIGDFNQANDVIDALKKMGVSITETEHGISYKIN